MDYRLLLPFLVTLNLVSVQALNNGLALTPPMGWLSWVAFRCNTNCKNDPDNCIGERLYMKMADLVASEGYKDGGYEYINIDDCWASKERDSQGRLMADPERFPNGMHGLAKYVHSKGLKLGIYADFGKKTCAGYPGSEFYMERDAKTFASWEIDMLKFDGCNADPKDMPIGYPIMTKYLNMTGRPILFMCEWAIDMHLAGLKPNYADVRDNCNYWRVYNDIEDSWDSVVSVIEYYAKDEGNFSAVAGPGGWNDPDSLIVGDYGLSYYQQKAQFGMWALFAAPLMMSVDLRTIDPWAKKLLQNKNIIAINQDPLGNQAVRILEKPVSIWVKKLSKPGSAAIGFLYLNNSGGRPKTYSTSFVTMGFSNLKGYRVREAFENVTIGSYGLSDVFTVRIDPTSIYMVIADPL